MTDFSTRYHSYSNAQLLDIIQNRKQYQYAAVKAAEEELNRRNPDAESLQLAKQELDERAERTASEKRKREEISNKIHAAKDQASNEVMNYWKSRRTKTDKGIISVSVVFTLVFLWYLSEEGDLLNFMLTNRDARWDVSALFTFLPLIVLPPAVILFFLKKKPGWILLTFHLCFTLAQLLPGLAISMLLGSLSGSVTSYIIGFGFYGLTAYYVCSEKVRKVFSVSKQELTWTAVIASVITIGVWYSLIEEWVL